MLEEVATLPVELKERRVLLHGQVWGDKDTQEGRPGSGSARSLSFHSSQPFPSRKWGGWVDREDEGFSCPSLVP